MLPVVGGAFGCVCRAFGCVGVVLDDLGTPHRLWAAFGACVGLLDERRKKNDIWGGGRSGGAYIGPAGQRDTRSAGWGGVGTLWAMTYIYEHAEGRRSRKITFIIYIYI